MPWTTVKRYEPSCHPHPPALQAALPHLAAHLSIAYCEVSWVVVYYGRESESREVEDMRKRIGVARTRELTNTAGGERA